jgi:hypothetical protein
MSCKKSFVGSVGEFPVEPPGAASQGIRSETVLPRSHLYRRLPGQGGGGVRWSDEKGGLKRMTFPREGLPFEGFRRLKDERLKINFVWLLLYITKAPQGHVSKV